jgi:hypothetical protein
MVILEAGELPMGSPLIAPNHLEDETPLGDYSGE